jgi:SAM-dependent methyltransferase
MTTLSPWLQIPLADYEAHMASSNVDQASLLADVLSTALQRFRPPSVAVIGCAGGNGFERIDPAVTGRVVGVDLNPDYLDATARRYWGRFEDLVLCNADIAGEELQGEPVDLIYAALIFEYVDMSAALRNLSSQCRQAGHLVAVLQLPSLQAPAITPTGVATVRCLASAMTLVDPSALVEGARASGFALAEFTMVTSSAGKQFAVQIYQMQPAD